MLRKNQPRFRLTTVVVSTAMASVVASSPGIAHVRWFVPAEVPDVEPYSLADPTVLAWIAIAVILVGIAIALDKILPTVPIANTKVRHDVMEMMRILTGMSLLLMAYDGAVLVPHLSATDGFSLSLVFLQAGIGLLLLSNNFLHQAAVLLLFLFVAMLYQFGVQRSLEYVNFVGIGLFLLFNYFPSDNMRERLKPYSVDVLRIFTGMSLVILGFSEKLFGVALGQAFIASHPWNFMPLLGVEWFDDRLFILSAGAMEVIIGLILILGVVTRLTMLVVAVLMFISNVVFLLQNDNDSALIELIGHLPIIATALILILLGYGRRLKVTNLFRHQQRISHSL